MRIALVYNQPLPSRYSALGEHGAVAGVLEAVEAVERALLATGHTVTRLGLQPPLANALATVPRLQADLVFNLFEGFDGCPETEGLVAQALEASGHPVTGASRATLDLCLDKGQAKEQLRAKGVPTPPWRLLDGERSRGCALDFPLIVKPLREDASHGIGPRSVVKDPQALADQVDWVGEWFGTPVLVERFLKGREFNVTGLGDRPPQVLPPSEMVYGSQAYGSRLLTYAAKWLPDDDAYRAADVRCPAEVSRGLARQINALAVAACQAVGSPPYARVDLRCDGRGRPYVLEVNPNPDLSPGAGVATQARAAGWEYERLIGAIVDLALAKS